MAVRLPDPASAGRLESLDPATLQPIGSVDVTSPEGVAAAVAASRAAQPGWAALPPRERASVIVRAAHVLLDRLDELAALCSREAGKPPVEALAAELFSTVDCLHWIASRGPRVLAPERVRFPQPYLWHKRATLEHEPLGVIAVIPAWNYPLLVPVTQAASALLAGNGVVVKPSEETPLIGEAIREVFDAAGLPRGLLQVVQGAGDVGEALVRSPVDKVLFTGSTATGRRVAAACAERPIPCVLELGGKDPMIVLEDADLDRAVAGATWASFFGSGQVCASVERIYVAEPIREAFTSRLAERAAALRCGDTADPDTELGPLIAERQYRVVEGLVEDARAAGGRVLTGGARADVELAGWFYAPTVIDGLPAGTRIDQEEIFGPVVTVAGFTGDAEAVRLANGSRYGLSASVWTRDVARGERVARRLEAGSVWINEHAYSYAAFQAPWGGTKESGYGRSHSKHGLYECTRITYLERDPGRLRDPWWFPYDAPSVELFRAVMGGLYGPTLGSRAAALWQGRRALAHGVGKMLRRG
jgi:succinate-semialdehyde dehydrogenase/glutarate-semialdehyde dehydrogenase